MLTEPFAEKYLNMALDNFITLQTRYSPAHNPLPSLQNQSWYSAYLQSNNKMIVVVTFSTFQNKFKVNKTTSQQGAIIESFELASQNSLISERTYAIIY